MVSRRVGLVAVVVGAVLGVVAHQTSDASASAVHRSAAVVPASSRPAAPPSAPPPAPPPVASPAPSRTTSAPPSPSRAAVTSTVHGRGPDGSIMTTGSRAVALTFDDGPDPVQTPRILNLLARYRVHATFCLVGQNVQAHPDLVRQIVAGGHTLCNHSWDHDEQLGRKSPAVIEADLERTNRAIRAAAPDAEIRYMRAPGGNFTPAFVAVIGRLGMTSLYWSVDPRDWDHSGGESDAAHRARVVAAIRGHARPGAVILSHDFGQPDTIAAYAQLLPWLTENYRLAAL